jgi:hypothetical protein
MERRALRKAAVHLRFVSQKEFILGLIEENEKLLSKLKARKILPDQIIYVSVHDAGSSSALCLNILRDHGHLERLGCYFVDSTDIKRISHLTNKIGSGVIIYVDDFAGTGQQFSKAQQYLATFVQGNFSHHVLFHTICPEAIEKIEPTGVDVQAYRFHPRESRPLHGASNLLTKTDRDLLSDRCRHISSAYGMGFGGLATMVVFYRNSPNTVPLVFRGQHGQVPWFGLVPRFDDLPPHSWEIA